MSETNNERFNEIIHLDIDAIKREVDAMSQDEFWQLMRACGWRDIPKRVHGRKFTFKDRDGRIYRGKVQRTRLITSYSILQGKYKQQYIRLRRGQWVSVQSVDFACVR